MRLHGVLPLAVITALSLFAQQEPKPAALQGNEQAAIINVKNLSGDSFNRLHSMLNVFNVRYSGDAKLRTILVYASSDVIAQIRKVVEELDRPGSEAAIGRNIEMTLTFLRCSTKPQAGTSELPADLEAVAKQLRAATQYKVVELWDIIPVRMQEGRPLEQHIRLPGSLPDQPSAMNTGHLNIIPESVTRKEAGRFVRFERFNIQLTIPYATGSRSQPNFQKMDVTLRTAGEFKEGQRTVVGKLSGSEDETATFVVVAVKVVD